MRKNMEGLNGRSTFEERQTLRDMHKNLEKVHDNAVDLHRGVIPAAHLIEMACPVRGCRTGVDRRCRDAECAQ